MAHDEDPPDAVAVALHHHGAVGGGDAVDNGHANDREPAIERRRREHDVVGLLAGDPAAIGAVCARLRKKGEAVTATVLHAGFADYVDDKDVIHHDLESFDAPRRH